LDASPYNVVHLDLAEGDEDPDRPGNRYGRASELLADWTRTGVLRRTPPAYFAYEVRFPFAGGTRTVRGVFCAMEIEPWGGSVLPHEDVMPGPVEDRLRLLRATRTHLSAIYGTVSGPCPPLAASLDRVMSERAGWSLTDHEGVEHRLWEVPADEPVADWLGDEPLLIADGHHRYTTALAYRAERQAEEGPGSWDRILTLVVDAGHNDVAVLPYHRVQVGGQAPDGGAPVPDLATALAEIDDQGLRYATVVSPSGGDVSYRVHRLSSAPPTVAALHRELLDDRAPGDALRFTHDVHDADDLVRSGAAVAAYLLPATTPDRILAVVRSGARLPRKSTFFWPKPRTGLVFMPVD
jgi:uncharacterized protein (DUF1015 family)